MSIDRLRRTLEADPSNEQNKTRLAIQRARTEGPQVYLEPLMDRDLWNRTNPGLQEHASQEVTRRLGDQFTFEGMRDWSCVVQARSPKEPHQNWVKSYTVSHRLGMFTHTTTGIEFNLLPGLDTWGHDPECGECMELQQRHQNALEECSSDDPEKIVFMGFKPFLIARWPVTRGQWYESAHGEGSGVPRIDSYGDRASLPSTGREYYEITSLMSHYDLSLPTPEQWEYACRAGTSTRFYWGDEFDSSYCWYDGNCTIGTNVDGEIRAINRGPHSPKEHEGKHNAFGLVDMIGNVWEWCNNARFCGFSFREQQQEIQVRSPLSWRGGPLDNVGFRPVVSVPGLGD